MCVGTYLHSCWRTCEAVHLSRSSIGLKPYHTVPAWIHVIRPETDSVGPWVYRDTSPPLVWYHLCTIQVAEMLKSILGQQTPYSLDCCTFAADGRVRRVSKIGNVPSHVHDDRSVACLGTEFQLCRGPIATAYQSRLHSTGMYPIPCKWR